MNAKNFKEDIEMFGEPTEGKFVIGMFFATLFSIPFWYLIIKGFIYLWE